MLLKGDMWFSTRTTLININKNYWKSSTRKENIEVTENVLFVLKRLTVVQNNMEIIKTEISVDVNDRVNLTDVDGRTAQFDPIPIIHHMDI